MQAQVTSRDEVTIKVNRDELALIDYALDVFQAHAYKSVNLPSSDAVRASELEQLLFKVYCQLSDEQAGIEADKNTAWTESFA